MTRLAILAALLLTAQTAPAPLPSPAPAAPAAQPQPALVRVQVTTSMGPFVLALEKDRAPVTTANFLRYVDAKRYDGTAFYRAMNASWGGGLIQAGVRDPKKLYPPIAHEPTSTTGVRHTDGAISMARHAPGTAQSDFSIMVGDMTGLDASAADPGFAAFGHVVEGMEVVKRIMAAPTSPTKGDGVMKGQMLEPTVTIVSMRRVG